MPYTIGIDARFYRQSTGGIGRYTRQLLHHLGVLDKTTLYKVFITESDAPEWRSPGPNFKPIVVAASHFSIAEQTIFLQLLYREHLDLVHFLNFNHPLFYHGKFITTLHDLTVYLQPTGRSAHSRLRREAFKRVFRRSLTSAKRVLAISEHTAEDAFMHLHIAHGKVDVIYEGGPEPYSPTNQERLEVRRLLQTDQPYILFLSQWREHKGIETLIDAYRKAAPKGTALVLAGGTRAANPFLIQSVEQLAKELPVITPGFVPDALLPALYAEASVFVMPSEYEGFGLPVLEAFAYGTPVIAAKNSSLTEVGGSAAQYFQTGNVDELAELLNSYLRSPEIIEAGYQQLKRFSWRTMAEQTRAAYQHVLEK